MQLSKKVASNIRSVREAKNLSRRQLGERCRPPTSWRQIEKLERGERRLTLDWVERIAVGLGLDPLQLLSMESGGALTLTSRSASPLLDPEESAR